MPVDGAVATNETALGAGLAHKRRAGSDAPYRVFIGIFAAIVGVVLVLYFYSIVAGSIPGFKVTGLGFFYRTDWNFYLNKYGAAPLIAGTLITTAMALLLAIPVSIGAAMAIVFLVPRRARTVMSATVEAWHSSRRSSLASGAPTSWRHGSRPRCSRG